MRLDKFLKNSRLIKRRTIANEACTQGRVSVNGKTAKAGTDVDKGDIIEIQFGNNKAKIKVEHVADHVKKEEASNMYSYIE